MKPYLVTFQMGIGNWRAAEQRENLCDQAISTLSLSLFVFIFPSLSFFILLYHFVFVTLCVFIICVFLCIPDDSNEISLYFSFGVCIVILAPARSSS